MGEQKFSILYARVNVQMKQKEYTAYVHLKRDSGCVAYGKQEFPARKGGCCKQIVALIFPILDYKELERTDKTK